MFEEWASGGQRGHCGRRPAFGTLFSYVVLIDWYAAPHVLLVDHASILKLV